MKILYSLTFQSNVFKNSTVFFKGYSFVSECEQVWLLLMFWSVLSVGLFTFEPNFRGFTLLFFSFFKVPTFRGKNAFWGILPIPISVCNIFMCSDNGVAASVWDF